MFLVEANEKYTGELAQFKKEVSAYDKNRRINSQAAWAFEIVAQRRIGSNYVILGNGQKPVNRQEQPSLRRPILQFGKVTTGSWA
ncbi:MAG: hypothetical protein ACLVCH_02765 [Roseburia inulinivorans]